MRLWKLQDLFDDIHKHNPKAKKYLTLRHVCENCGEITQELAPIDSKASGEIPLNPPRIYEIKNHGVCDKCNIRFWQKVDEHITYSKENCKWCGGRCSHYPEVE